MGTGKDKIHSMRICIDGRLINESGIGRYIRNLLANLSVIDTKNEYFVLLKKKDLQKFNWGKNFENIEADFGWYSATEQIKLPQILKKLNLDLTHFPHFNVPVFYKGKFIVTIHDLIHQHFIMKRATTLDPLTYKIKQFGYRKVFDYAVKKSQKIIVPSEFVRSQLKDEWGINDGKVVVTYEGVDEKIITIKNKQTKNLQLKILEKIGIKKPYIFYIGNAHPHKNIEGLIKAFKKIKEGKVPNVSKVPKGNSEKAFGTSGTFGTFDTLSLVLAGGDHYFWKKIKQEFNDPDIIYPGYVTDDSLVTLFANAEMFVMPSFEEGFGIPVLESFAVGCPVVCSDIGALKEVGQSGALYFNPKDINDIAEKITRVLEDENLKKKLIENGEKRVKGFSWKKLADETLKIYLEI